MTTNHNNLAKYYKKVRTCSRCSRIYGDDTNLEKSICPICIALQQGKKFRLPLETKEVEE